MGDPSCTPEADDPTCVSNVPLLSRMRPDPLIVAEDQPRQPGERVDHRGDGVVVGPTRVERDPRDAGAVVGEAGVVENVQGRVGQERLLRAADEVLVRGRIRATRDVVHEDREAQLHRVGDGGRAGGGQIDRTAVIGEVGIGDQRVGVPDVGRIDAGQRGLAAVAQLPPR